MNLLRTLFVLIVIATVSGCGSSSSTSPASGARSAQPGSAAPSTRAAAATGTAVAVCGLMPPAVVAKIVGQPLNTAKEIDVPNLKMYQCVYNSADGSAALNLSVIAQDAKLMYTGNLEGSENHPVSGLGDKAALTTSGLDALFGDVLITASVPTAVSQDATKKLIETLHDKL
ncbi:MAG: hypothetical protein ABI345_13075 [Jatrophihabitans sp.]